jgi:hypothetical protein
LHNWLLEADGLDENWESGVPSEWEGELGAIPVEGDVGNAIQNLTHNLLDCTFVDDDDRDAETMSQDSILPNGTRIVRHLSQKFFRQRLVEHFHILWERNELVWPQRTRETRPSYP